MERRISVISEGTVIPQAAVKVDELWDQHESYRQQFLRYFRSIAVESHWPQAELTLESLAQKCGLLF